MHRGPGGLKGLPESITTTWELAQVQTCVVHLIRNTFRYAARKDWDAMAKDLRPIYTAPSVQAAEARLAEFAERWQGKYPAAVKAWRSAWVEYIGVPGLRGRDPQGHLPRPTRSSPQAPATGARSGPGATSPTRPPR